MPDYSNFKARLENAQKINKILVKIGGHQCPEQILVNTEGSPMLHRTPYRLRVSKTRDGSFCLKFNFKQKYSFHKETSSFADVKDEGIVKPCGNTRDCIPI